ncbi:MAG TPA: efflux RND transporter permease subunit, partial [Phycisphaerae bacterium]|nr:efflux RND transporter permease subunit [Phycisphaerae bacterium]
MNITGLFIRRPAATALIMLAILAFGLLAYRDLAVSDLPNVDFPTIQVSANLSGASPETMASAVATPLEKQFTTIAGLDSMTSTSALGSTQITLQFDLSRNIDSAALDVQSAITSAADQLPPNMPSPPTFKKVNPADSPVLFLALTSNTLPLSMVDEYAETLLGQQISMVPGVAQVGVFGSMKYAVRVQVDPEQLAARRIGIDEVLHSIQNANVNMPMGTLDGAHSAFNIQSNGQLTDASLYRPLIVAYRNGAPVRLHEVATVADSVEDNRQAGWINGEPGIILSIQRQPGTNTIEVVDGILKLLPRFRSIMPPAMHLTIEYDRSISIRESVNDVKFTLFLAICLVVLVIFLFLRNLSATLIPSLAVPMSIVGTFAVMYLLGYTIDNLSLLALTLSVGFVVDDAIVMLENIVRHIEQGKGVREAAFDGSREIGFTIISMTLSLAAVFLPVFFMGGIIGRLLHEFAVVIASAVLVSGLVSLTLTPMICSRYLRAADAREHGRVYRTLENVLEAALRRYGYTLQWALRHRVVVMLFGGAILAGTAWEFWTIPKGFLPEEDTSQIYVFSEARQGISFGAMKKYQEALNQTILADPNTLQFFSRIAASNTTGLNNGRASVHLKELYDRPWTDNPTYDRLAQRFGEVPVAGSLVRG